jgi:enoyl-CoA hydratase
MPAKSPRTALSIAVSKQVLGESQDWSSTEMFDRQNELTTKVFKSADAREGASAFAEKRAPVWRGE